MQDNNPYAAPNAVVGDAQVTEQQLAGRGVLYLAGLEGFDHALALGHAADPFVGFDAHWGLF